VASQLWSLKAKLICHFTVGCTDSAASPAAPAALRASVDSPANVQQDNRDGLLLLLIPGPPALREGRGNNEEEPAESLGPEAGDDDDEEDKDGESVTSRLQT